MYMKKLFFLMAMLVSAFQLAAQKIQMTIEFPAASDVEGLRLFMAPMGTTYTKMKEMAPSGNKMTTELNASAFGFYSVMSVKGQSQFAVPVYVPAGKTAVTLKAKMQDGKMLQFVNGADNEVLSAFALNLANRDRKLWMEKLTDDEVRKMFGNYAQQAEDATKGKTVSKPVKDYLKIWSYISTDNALASLHRALKVDEDKVPVKRADVLPSAKEALDNEMAAIVQGAPAIIMRDMPKGKLTDNIEWLRANYKTKSLRTRLETAMMEDYMSKFDYWTNFEKGLAEIKSIVAKYGFDNKYVKEFEKFKQATKGAAFPAEVVLKDTKGNVVDFAKFKGKYVYIDIWASWCGPCCQEVPVLQKLEKELKNDNVVFVSISVDATEKPWKSKMTALNMHGNQLIDSSKNFNKLMNIRGIPHFLIYDKEGKLYMYDAPRPSDAGTREMLENLK